MANKKSSNFYGFESAYQQYLNWLVERRDKFKRNALLGTIASIAVVAIASVLPLPRFLVAAISFPAALVLFLVLLGFFFFRSANNPERLTIRERYSPRIRQRIAIFLGFVLIVSLITASSVIPYAVGGTVLLVSVLGLYNMARRTPEEFALAAAGLPDPRDTKNDADNVDNLEDEDYVDEYEQQTEKEEQ